MKKSRKLAQTLMETIQHLTPGSEIDRSNGRGLLISTTVQKGDKSIGILENLTLEIYDHETHKHYKLTEIKEALNELKDKTIILGFAQTATNPKQSTTPQTEPNQPQTP